MDELKTQKRNSTNCGKDGACSRHESPCPSNVSREEGKKGAKEPLYLLRYE